MARWWGQNIKIDGTWLRETNDNYTRWMGTDAGNWETETQNVFRKIEGSQTGKILLRCLNSLTSRRLAVIPIRAASFPQTSAKPADWTRAMRKGHQFECPATETCSGTPVGVGMAPHSKLMRGTGEGVNVRLYFHPSGWSAHGQVRAADVSAGIDTLDDNVRPDDVLFHELVHAYRAMKGTFEMVPTGDAWDATEEFFAIVLTNIYVSETRPSGRLRGDHQMKFTSLQDANPSLANDPNGGAFYLTHITRMEQLLQEMPEICNPLKQTAAGKRIPAQWNPIRKAQEIDDQRGMWSSTRAERLGDMMSKR